MKTALQSDSTRTSQECLLAHSSARMVPPTAHSWLSGTVSYQCAERRLRAST